MDLFWFLEKRHCICVLHCLKVFHVNFGWQIQRGYRVMRGGLNFVMPQLCCTGCALVTGQRSRNSEGLYRFCWNLTYKCCTVLPPHKKNSSLGVGRFTQYTHLSSLKYCIFGQNFDVWSWFVALLTSANTGKGCIDFAETSHTSASVSSPLTKKISSLGMGGFTQYTHSSSSKREVDFSMGRVVCCVSQCGWLQTGKGCIDFV